MSENKDKGTKKAAKSQENDSDSNILELDKKGKEKKAAKKSDQQKKGPNVDEDKDEKKAGETAESEGQEEDSDKEQQVEVEEDFKAKYYYLAAEMQNMRKRYEREKASFIKFGNEKILSSLLEVVDNLDRTLDALKEDKDDKVKNIVSGVAMVRTQFVNVLKENGLSEIQALGETFDPNFHEAMATQPAEGKKDQEIILEYQKGYTLNGRLLRAAKVIIAKGEE